MSTIEEMLEMEPEQLKGAIEKWIRDEYWKRRYAAQDDLLMNGTDNASDESLEMFGLKRTDSQGAR